MIIDLRKQISIVKSCRSVLGGLQSSYSRVTFLLQWQIIVIKITTLVNYSFTFLNHD